METNSSNLEKTYNQLIANYKNCGMLTIFPFNAVYEFSFGGINWLNVMLTPGALLASPIFLGLGLTAATVNTVWGVGALSKAAYEDYYDSKELAVAADLPSDLNGSHKTMQAQMPAHVPEAEVSNDVQASVEAVVESSDESTLTETIRPLR